MFAQFGKDIFTVLAEYASALLLTFAIYLAYFDSHFDI